MQTHTFIESCIHHIDNALRTLISPQPRISSRPSPAEPITESALTSEEKKHVGGLMRVNLAGEVCAQALYYGASLTASTPAIKQQMIHASYEEEDHLAWCEQRLHELDIKPSLLNPLWYAGSLLLGAAAGLAGDKLSLGFVAETERQVGLHLKDHLEKLPLADNKTKILIQVMQEDEAKHEHDAINAGAFMLPWFIKILMRGASRVMTQSSYYV